MTSNQKTSHHIKSHQITSHQIKSNQITSHHITCITWFTANLKNINDWLSDNFKSRDASASKKFQHFPPWPKWWARLPRIRAWSIGGSLFCSRAATALWPTEFLGANAQVLAWSMNWGILTLPVSCHAPPEDTVLRMPCSSESLFPHRAKRQETRLPNGNRAVTEDKWEKARVAAKRREVARRL